MADVVENTDYVAQAKARLLEQYKNSTNLSSVIEALVVQLQETEGMFIDLRDNRTLDNATGTTLDMIGSIVGVARIVGEADEPYRLRVRQGIFKNRSQGTPEILIEVVTNFTLSTSILFFEGAIASFAFNISDETLTQDEIDGLYSALREAKAAGVRIEHITAFNETNAFTFADGVGGGFGDTTNASIGGEFASVLVES
jgi:hypothetical protein